MLHFDWLGFVRLVSSLGIVGMGANLSKETCLVGIRGDCDVLFLLGPTIWMLSHRLIRLRRCNLCMPMRLVDERHLELLLVEELEDTQGAFASSRHICSSLQWEIASNSKYSCSGVYDMALMVWSLNITELFM